MLDILELDIKSRKIFLKATAESAAQIDALSEALSKVECFDDVQKGKVSSVPAPPGSAPPPPPAGADTDKPPAPAELKQFSLTIETKCN